MALLNAADAIYFGDRPVDRVYLGARQVWPWTPELLFQNGEQGGFWDFTNPDGLFQDAIGTVPVENPGDPIGMATDLSGNGNHLLQATVPARPTFTPQGALHDGVDDFLMAANAEDWTFLHDGTGGYMAASSEYREGGGEGASYIGTQTAAGASLGASTGLQSAGTARTFSRVTNGSDIAPGAINTPSGTFPIGLMGTQEFEVNTTGARAWSLGELYRDASFGDFVPSATSPSSPMRTQINTQGTSAVRRRMLAISRVLTNTELALVRSWLMEGVE